MANTGDFHVPITGGMRQDLSEHMAPTGTLRYASNVRLHREGEAEGRPGTVALSAVTNATVTYESVLSDGPDYLSEVPGGFIFGAKGFGYRYDFGRSAAFVSGSYASALPAGKFTTTAREDLTPATGTYPGANTPFPPSQAVSGGYVCTMHASDSAGVFFQVFTESGAPVAASDFPTFKDGFVIEDALAPGRFVVVCQDALDIKATVVDTSSLGGAIVTTIVGTLNATDSRWAIAAWPGNGWALVYTSGGSTATLKKLAGVTVNATQTFAVGTDVVYSLFCNTTRVFANFTEVSGGSTFARTRIYDTGLTLVSGGSLTTRNVAVGTRAMGPPLVGAAGVANTVLVVVGTKDANGAAINAATILGDSTLTASTVTTYGVLPLSAPFNGGMVWCMQYSAGNVLGDSSQRNVLLDYQAMRVGGSSSLQTQYPKLALSGEAYVAGASYLGGLYLLGLSAPRQLSDGRWLMGLPRVVRNQFYENAAEGLVTSGLAIVEWLRFETDKRRGSTVFGQAPLIGGGQLVSARVPYGNYSVGTLAGQHMGQDVGLITPPTFKTAIGTTVSGGSLAISVQYQWRMVVERIDSNGDRYRSAPSVAKVATLTGAQNAYQITVYYPDNLLRFYSAIGGARPAVDSRYVIHIYRTTAGGSTFYRVTPPQGAPTPTNATVVYTDSMQDAVAQQNEILYTDGGVLQNDHPPAHRYLRATEDRVWLGGLWDATQIQSSKILVPGEPPQFSDLASFRVPLPNGGECTGLAVQDGSVVAFCADSIYAIQGYGPNDQGQGDWGSPRSITKSTGCINAQSILETGVGVFFQSSRGIEVLPRGMGEPQFIGEAVTDLVEGNTVTSASVVSVGGSTSARFCLGTTSVIVYEMSTGAWSVDVYPYAVSQIADTEQGAVLGLATAQGSISFLREDTSATQDAVGGTPVAIPSALAWCSCRPSGVAGWGQFNTCVGMFDASAVGYQSGLATMSMSVDTEQATATDPGAQFAMASMSGACYRGHVPKAVMGSACRLVLTTTATGWRFMGWTVGYKEQGGPRRLASTEKA